MKIGFIGCGRMGSALLEGALRANIVTAPDVWIFDPYPGAAEAAAEKFGVTVAANNSEVTRECDMVLLACKPYHVVDILGENGFASRWVGSEAVARYVLRARLLSVCDCLNTKVAVALAAGSA